MKRQRDFLDPEARSALMSRIRSKGGKAEVALARLLRKNKIKFRRHVRTLPGTPDFVLVGHAVAVFVDGGFWHGREFERLRPSLKPYWVSKIQRNMKRDRSCRAELRLLGWSVIRLWETDVLGRPEKCFTRLLAAINKRSTNRA